MFKAAGKHGGPNGFLDTGSHMTGELHFEDEFQIHGKFTGSIVSEGELFVGEGGDVDGEIRVRQVFVSGTVRGTLRASERVEVTSAGKVFADLHTPSLMIEEGALFEGRCSMDRPSGAVGAATVTQIPVAKG